jgi:hypothetical protein
MSLGAILIDVERPKLRSQSGSRDPWRGRGTGRFEYGLCRHQSLPLGVSAIPAAYLSPTVATEAFDGEFKHCRVATASRELYSQGVGFGKSFRRQ